MTNDDSLGLYVLHVVWRIVKLSITHMTCIQAYNIKTMDFVKPLYPQVGIYTRLSFSPF